MPGHRNTNGDSFSLYGWFVCIWVLVIPFQYGYHTSALNQIKAVLTCERTEEHLPLDNSFFPSCIQMSNFVFSFVTAVFTVGGLLGSLVANIVMDRLGRKGASQVTALFHVVGTALMGASGSVTSLIFGRFLIGVGSGIGICVAPVYAAEIAPSTISGSIGVLTQLGIVLGIMSTQIIGFRYSMPSEWRYVLFLSSAIGFIQLVTGYLITESPAWLGAQNRSEEKKVVSRRLWRASAHSTTPPVADDENPLLEGAEARRPADSTKRATVLQLFSSPELHKPLMITCFAMVSQQISGVNAVLYYSNEILSKSLPDLGPYVSLGITVVNVIMTFPPIILIERAGRKSLLSSSVIGALASLAAIGFGLNNGFSTMTSIATLTFIMCVIFYGYALSCVPFVLIPEVSPPHAVSALSSMALSFNWVTNFFVGLVFLPLRSFLSGEDPLKEGRVFYVFAGVLMVASFSLFKVYRG